MKISPLLYALGALSAPAAALAQPAAPPAPLPGGLRLDVVATGEVTRTPDIVTIGAGVVTRAPQATRSSALRRATRPPPTTRTGRPATTRPTG